MKRLALLLPAVAMAMAAAASPALADHDEEVLVPSQQIEVGPVSTSTPELVRPWLRAAASARRVSEGAK